MKRLLVIALVLLTTLAVEAQTAKKSSTSLSSSSAGVTFNRYNPQLEPLSPLRLTPSKTGYNEPIPEQSYGPKTYYIYAPGKPSVDKPDYRSIYDDMRRWCYLTSDQSKAEMERMGGVLLKANKCPKWMEKHPNDTYLVDDQYYVRIIYASMEESDHIPRVEGMQVSYTIPTSEVQRVANTIWSAYNDWCYFKVAKNGLLHGDRADVETYNDHMFTIGHYFNLQKGHFASYPKNGQFVQEYLNYNDIVKRNLQSKGFMVEGGANEVNFAYTLSMITFKEEVVVTVGVEVLVNLGCFRPASTPQVEKKLVVDEFQSIEPAYRKALKEQKIEHLYRD